MINRNYGGKTNDRPMVSSFRELIYIADEIGLKHQVIPGNVYWVKNSLLQFDDNQDTKWHPVLVVDVTESYAGVCILTSKLEQKEKKGIHFESIPEARLGRPGVVITMPFGQRLIENTYLNRSNYCGSLCPNNYWILMKAQIACRQSGRVGLLPNWVYKTHLEVVPA
jgi:hypothetical protein